MQLATPALPCQHAQQDVPVTLCRCVVAPPESACAVACDAAGGVAVLAPDTTHRGPEAGLVAVACHNLGCPAAAVVPGGRASCSCNAIMDTLQLHGGTAPQEACALEGMPCHRLVPRWPQAQLMRVRRLRRCHGCSLIQGLSGAAAWAPGSRTDDSLGSRSAYSETCIPCRAGSLCFEGLSGQESPLGRPAGTSVAAAAAASPSTAVAPSATAAPTEVSVQPWQMRILLGDG